MNIVKNSYYNSFEEKHAFKTSCQFASTCSREVLIRLRDYDNSSICYKKIFGRMRYTNAYIPQSYEFGSA